MAIITIKDLQKTYNSSQVPVHALNGVDLTIDEGEFTAIVGPSGSGKTTLLNIIGGLDDPNEGQVIINDTEINQLSRGEKIDFRLHHIGFIFQAYNLIPVLTARENIEFILELQGIPKSKRRQRSNELLEAVGIPEKADIRPRQLSGGQQQRIAVARALASRPRFILADEPTANLDSASADNLLTIMEELNKKEKTTFIFSTHDARVVKKARRVVTLEDGKIKSDSKR
ncbi:ABC transporter ATP-binding protein [Marinilabilia salmonicolor]|jgi:putative ABC transport system ATP-binding protein|uniref:Putative ABC transport system ATP-binding protein n=1 Tax=Marinilabilia salmonicolor TaxID=989 RepID=A0A368UNQ5_9BACT|nr:ABC transporter ATP-binding protein [Marinilabilia salmonicolor]RCW29815.1 putative ABC transport system ATP-binding protein [Marinilabilia salmonicolor]